MSNVLSYQVLLDEFATAGTDLAQYHAVVVDPATKVATICPAGDRATGIILTAAAAGEPIRVITDGVIPAKTGAVTGITEGARLFVGANGVLVGTAVDGDIQSAYAESAAGDAGDLIRVRVSKLIEYTEPA